MSEENATETKYRLVSLIRIEGTIEVLTGLTIGGMDTFGIGGIDKEVVRDPLTGKPYIPGSSLKGKMRSLLELAEVGVTIETNDDGEETGPPHSCNALDCKLCTVFGAHRTQDEPPIRRGPTRLIVRDAFLRETDEATRFHDATSRWVDLKTENMIDRLSGTALNPRTFERVPPGMRFDLDILYRVFERSENGAGDGGSSDLARLPFVRKGIALVGHDYLGSSGSRGYGRVKITTRPPACVHGEEFRFEDNWTVADQEAEQCDDE